MMFFAFWVALIAIAIASVPIASWLDKRKLAAAYSEFDPVDSLEDDSEHPDGQAESGAAGEPAPSSLFAIVPDGPESRTYDLLDGIIGDEAIGEFPDLDLAYLQAAYPGGATDHETASPGLLLNGVQEATRKSWLLGRLSTYWLAKGDPQQSFEYGVKSLLSTDDVSAPEVAATIHLLQPVFQATKHADLAAKLESIQPPADEDAIDPKSLKKAVKKIATRKGKVTIAEAADLLRDKSL